MNTGNQISARPGIRVYAGIASGGSYSSIFGGGDEAVSSGKNRHQAASRILKETQAQAQAPTGKIGREPAGKGLARRTVIDASSDGQFSNEQIPGLPGYQAPAAQERPREVESPPMAARPKGVERAPAEGTSLCFGDDKGHRGNQRQARRQRETRNDAPDWMGSHSQSNAPAAPARQIIDCSPPNSQPADGNSQRQNYRADAQDGGQPTYSSKRSLQGRPSQISLGHADAASNVNHGNYMQGAQARMKSRPF